MIGIIDSGKGALAIAKKIINENHQYIILLDEEYFPFGEKSKIFLLKRSYYLVDYLIKRGVSKVVLACNTLSVIALPFLKSCFDIEIIGVFDFLIPHLTSNNVFIGSYHTCKYVERNYDIKCLYGNEFIEAIEKNKDYLKVLDNLKKEYQNYDNLVLGCTHFLAIKEEDYGIKTINQLKLLKEYLDK